MLIESIIKRPKGTKVELGGILYQFLPDHEGRHVAEVDEESHIAQLLAVKDGYRPADGSVPLSPIGVAMPDGYFFLFRGPQDAEAFGQWARSIPEFQDFPVDEPVLLVDKIAMGEASLGGYALASKDSESSASASAVSRASDTPPVPEHSHRESAGTTILPSSAGLEVENGGEAPASPASEPEGDGAGAAGGVGAASDAKDEDPDKDKDDDEDLDREALAKEYDELFGHRPNGKWKADKIKAAIDDHKAKG